MSKYPQIAANRKAQRAYEQMREAGESHAIAEMLALQQFPGIKGTDSVFLEGHCCGSQFAHSPHIGNYYRRQAQLARVDTTGKVYLSGLAKYPGDPRAWVSGRHDVQKICEERNWDCTGAVTHKSIDMGVAPQEVDVADDIVDKAVSSYCERNPEPIKDMGELRYNLKQKLKGN